MRILSQVGNRRAFLRRWRVRCDISGRKQQWYKEHSGKNVLQKRVRAKALSLS